MRRLLFVSTVIMLAVILCNTASGEVRELRFGDWKLTRNIHPVDGVPVIATYATSHYTKETRYILILKIERHSGFKNPDVYLIAACNESGFVSQLPITSPYFYYAFNYGETPKKKKGSPWKACLVIEGEEARQFIRELTNPKHQSVQFSVQTAEGLLSFSISLYGLSEVLDTYDDEFFN
ncbi:hypothetical protein [Candidatus Caldatribacterium sp.]|uniref:hypothetical protein n=1 Tax=Candidatus Caldatribacterium sp. TaxID=2282143 RepID=UPI0038419925|nr:hypothetical protein [Candidatus Caldatribacterium sp.]